MRVAAVALLPVILLPQLLKPVTASVGFHGHGYCYLWDPALVTINVSSDVLIGLSYVAISGTLAYFVYCGRRRIPFHWMFQIGRASCRERVYVLV